jgi:serine/threonine protein kinase
MNASWDARPGDGFATESVPDLVSRADRSSLFRPWAVPAGGLVAGRYRLLSQLGCGSMGMVWLAKDNLLCRSVALKQAVLRGSGSVDAPTTALSRARSEARTVARIDHPGVLRIHDLVEDDGSIWLVTELLSGCTLGEALGAGGPLPVGEVTRIALGLLDALRATHLAGVVHRDVKPGNVYLCDDGRVVLIDFGIAQAVDDESTVASAEFVGSPAYVAPERIENGDVGPASDLFSLGATLFAAVEGVPPFRRGSIFETIAAVLEDVPGPFVRAGAMRPVIEGLLAKQPDRRLSAQAALDALEAIGP